MSTCMFWVKEMKTLIRCLCWVSMHYSGGEQGSWIWKPLARVQMLWRVKNVLWRRIRLWEWFKYHDKKSSFECDDSETGVVLPELREKRNFQWCKMGFGCEVWQPQEFLYCVGPVHNLFPMGWKKLIILAFWLCFDVESMNMLENKWNLCNFLHSKTSCCYNKWVQKCSQFQLWLGIKWNIDWF